jgi:DNA-binding PadR family transcriptional regulator
LSPVFRHGSLRLYLLRLLDEEPRHGYEVIRLLRDRFMGVYSPSPGTIYPRLARLEEEGLVTHDEVDGRKVYRITEAGREELRSRSDELDELEEELSASVSDIVREVREDVRQTVRSLREELTWAARESRRAHREMGATLGEHSPDQPRSDRDEARERARQAREDAKEAAARAREGAKEAAAQAREDAKDAAAQAREDAKDAAAQAREGAKDAAAQAREGARQARDDAQQAREDARARVRQARDELREQAKRARDELLGSDAARRVQEHAQRLREEAQRARDETHGRPDEGGPADEGSRDRDRERAGSTGARFTDAEGDWDQGWTSWTGWPGRRGWEEWTRLRGRGGWAGPDMGTLRDLERVAVQFTADLRKLALQSTSAGENVIGDLRVILEEALERIKTEIFRTGRDESAGSPPADSPDAGPK